MCAVFFGGVGARVKAPYIRSSAILYIRCRCCIYAWVMGQHNVRVDDDLWSAAMVKARGEGRDLTAVIVAALSDYAGGAGPVREPRRRKAGPAAAPQSPVASSPPSAGSAPRRCTHPGTRIIGGRCRECDHVVEPGGLWRV